MEVIIGIKAGNKLRIGRGASASDWFPICLVIKGYDRDWKETKGEVPGGNYDDREKQGRNPTS